MKTGIVIVAVLVVAGAGFFAYIWISGGSGEPSAAAQAERIEPQEPQQVVYEVVDARSEARFIIEEVLRGEPNTVVGRTDQIDGSIAVQFEPAMVEIGQFVINVRTIRTDDEVRDRTIRTLILESNKDEFEFSTFDPTAVTGVPEVIEVGDRLDLDVTGNLTVRGVTSEVTFDMTLNVQSEEEITGTASTTILWEDFDITIPYVGGNSIVASVSDEVGLELEFAAGARED
ncbi:MAG: YceI family protein [Spirochaetes bacterium]|nr:YceI family protein [Spirochaetota bacterium]